MCLSPELATQCVHCADNQLSVVLGHAPNGGILGVAKTFWR